MSDKSRIIPAPQYTLHEAIAVCLAMCQRALAEVRGLARMPGPQGETGAHGEPGEKGERGERGPKGEPGRNASDLTLLQDHIDERLERAIEAMAVTTPDGGRTLRFAFGDKVREIKTALVLDAGPWKEGASYVPGDGVSFGGSFFIAQVETIAKPEQNKDWRLAVKRGGEYRPEDKRTTSKNEPIRFK